MDKFFKIMLVIVAALLALNLLQGRIISFFAEEGIVARAETFSPLKHVACSYDGKYVYVVSGTKLFRSEYGYGWLDVTPPY